MAFETANFKITTYGFGELAQLYLPHIKTKSASSRLAAWIQHNESLQNSLNKIGYRKGLKVLTPQMVKVMVEYLGEPG